MKVISRAPSELAQSASDEGTHTPFKEDTTHAVHVTHAALKHISPPPAQQDALHNQLNKETPLHNPMIEGFMQQQSMPSPVAAGGGGGGGRR
jgi:hypothetical protein